MLPQDDIFASAAPVRRRDCHWNMPPIIVLVVLAIYLHIWLLQQEELEERNGTPIGWRLTAQSKMDLLPSRKGEKKGRFGQLLRITANQCNQCHQW